MLYSVLRSLGIDVAILPIPEKDGQYGIQNQDLGIMDGHYGGWYRTTPPST